MGLLEFLELFLDVISLILDFLPGFVVDVDTIWSLLDVLLKLTEEFVDLFLEFLTLFRGTE